MTKKTSSKYLWRPHGFRTLLLILSLVLTLSFQNCSENNSSPSGTMFDSMGQGSNSLSGGETPTIESVKLYQNGQETSVYQIGGTLEIEVKTRNASQCAYPAKDGSLRDCSSGTVRFTVNVANTYNSEPFFGAAQLRAVNAINRREVNASFASQCPWGGTECRFIRLEPEDLNAPRALGVRLGHFDGKQCNDSLMQKNSFDFPGPIANLCMKTKALVGSGQGVISKCYYHGAAQPPEQGISVPCDGVTFLESGGFTLGSWAGPSTTAERAKFSVVWEDTSQKIKRVDSVTYVSQCSANSGPRTCTFAPEL
ncbi:MAG: hypothetical protein COT74_02705 [Bdellovibrionales bacterium CG10_big_fil_rev_8_21_14_0_10_45_34]|nr:MAG: hypothetical protein COT74_02705 [Bdellovibrionales bacterium CG10_big_fil_rev_8_21_14_0_10_45_34]